MRAPDVLGDYGKAWQVPLDIQRAWVGEHIDNIPAGVLDNRLAVWYVNGRAYHPLHSWWMIALDRLIAPFDQKAERRPGVKLYQEARYEIIGWTLAWKPDVNGRSLYEVVGEYTLWHQFHGITDAQAEAVAYTHVRAICAGRTDPRRDWMENNREALNRIVNDFHQGKFGGPARPALEVDPYTKRFVGTEEEA